jgi:hypothetical protein
MKVFVALFCPPSTRTYFALIVENVDLTHLAIQPALISVHGSSDQSQLGASNMMEACFYCLVIVVDP